MLSVRLFTEWLKEHDRPLSVDVSRDDVRGFLIDQRKHNSASTALVRYKSLQQFFKFLVTERELDESPMTGMSAPEVKPKAPPIVEDDVLKRLIKARSGDSLGDLRDAALLRLFLDTGCRLSEVTNLRQGDVDTKHHKITVTGKGDKDREVGVGTKALQAVNRYLRQLRKERGECIGDTKPLWVGRTGGKMTTSGITNALHKMCSDANVPRLHWHQFRHTFAHTWMASGASETDLMTAAGWQSRSMLDTYARVSRQDRALDTHHRLALGDRV